MSYLIYNTIDQISFNRMKEVIRSLRISFDDFLLPKGFNISREPLLVDILGLDYVSYGPRYDGNIGFLFNDDTILEQTFTFYVAKSFDENNRRFSKRIDLLKHAPLEYIVENKANLLKEAFSVYESIVDKDMTKMINLKK
jgi:hypothetical protein